MKRKSRKLIVTMLVLALGFALVPMSASAGSERGVARFEEIIAPQYEDAGLFREGLAPVKKDGKWGYIDLENRTAVPFEYDYACYFSEGHAVVGKLGTAKEMRWDFDESGRYYSYEAEVEAMYLGRVDLNGNYKPFVVRVFDYQTFSTTTQGIFMYLESWVPTQMYYYYGGWVSIDYINVNAGDQIGANVFDTDGNQFTGVELYHRATFAPTEGLVVARVAYEEYAEDRFYTGCYLDLDGNLVLAYSADSEVRYYDANGNELTWPIDDWNQIHYSKSISFGLPFNQGLAPAWESTVYRSEQESVEKLGFIDRSGNWVIEPQFDNYYVIGLRGRYQVFADNGLASVGKDGKFGAIDMTGRVVIPFRYDTLWPFLEGLAVFELNGRSGYIDSAGNEVIPAKFLSATGFYNGFAVAYDGTKVMLIDRNGNPIQGADTINLDAYYTEHDDGSASSHTPDENVTIVVGGRYGFGKLSYDPPLPDVSEMDVWAHPEVVAAIEANLVPTSLQNQYRSNITRGDYCSLIIKAVCEMLGAERDDLVRQRTGRTIQQHVAGYPFIDSTSSDVIAAYALGLVTGYDEGGGKFSYQPNNLIIRQEAAVLLWRAAGLLGMDTANPTASSFSDRNSIPDWARTQVDYVNSIGVMRGADEYTFAPLGHYARQHSYITIFRLLNAMLAEQG